MAVSNSNNVHKQQIDSSLRSIVFVSGSDINEFDAMLILRPFLTNLILDALDCLEGRMRLHCGYFSQNGITSGTFCVTRTGISQSNN